MATKYPELFAALAAPFDARQVKQRKQGNQFLDYITARTAENRLDEVLGPENWKDTYHEFLGNHAVKCCLTIILPDGTEITKEGIGGITEMHDTSDTDKTGESDALKRAAVKFGVGRYLYKDGVPSFARGRQSDHVPQPTHRQQEPPQESRSEPPRSSGGSERIPTHGRALFAWVKDQEQKQNVALLKYLNDWSKLQEYPGRMVDWDEEQVALGYQEACRKLGRPAPPAAERSSTDLNDLRQQILQHTETIARAGRSEDYLPDDREINIAMSNVDQRVTRRWGDQALISDINQCQDVRKLRQYLAEAEAEAKEASEIPVL